MKTILLTIAILMVLGVFASFLVFVFIGASSRKLPESRRESEKENRESLKGGE